MASDDFSFVLRNSSFFNCFNEVEKRAMLSVCSHETWQKGHCVSSEEMQETLYFVVSGRVKSTRIDVETGHMLTLFLFETGDVFDILQLLHGAPDDTLFEAFSDVSLLAAPQAEVSQWINRYPDFNRAILPYLGRMIQHLEDLAAGLALHDTETRLAHLITHHLSSNGHNGFHIVNNMSHENLAQMIGSVRTVVNRQLQHWKKSGVISTDNGRITINRLQSLLNIAEKHTPRLKRDDPPDGNPPEN